MMMEGGKMRSPRSTENADLWNDAADEWGATMHENSLVDASSPLQSPTPPPPPPPEDFREEQPMPPTPSSAELGGLASPPSQENQTFAPAAMPHHAGSFVSSAEPAASSSSSSQSRSSKAGGEAGIVAMSRGSVGGGAYHTPLNSEPPSASSESRSSFDFGRAPPIPPPPLAFGSAAASSSINRRAKPTSGSAASPPRQLPPQLSDSSISREAEQWADAELAAASLIAKLEAPRTTEAHTDSRHHRDIDEVFKEPLAEIQEFMGIKSAASGIGGASKDSPVAVSSLSPTPAAPPSSDDCPPPVVEPSPSVTQQTSATFARAPLSLGTTRAATVVINAQPQPTSSSSSIGKKSAPVQSPGSGGQPSATPQATAVSSSGKEILFSPADFDFLKRSSPASTKDLRPANDVVAAASANSSGLNSHRDLLSDSSRATTSDAFRPAPSPTNARDSRREAPAIGSAHPRGGRGVHDDDGKQLWRKSSTSSVGSAFSLFDIPKPGRNSAPPDSTLPGGEDEAPGARRPAADVAPEELEDADKKSISVFDSAKMKLTPVSWYADMTLGDVKEAILCACDAMMDSGFRLVELIPQNLLDRETEEDERRKLRETSSPSAAVTTQSVGGTTLPLRTVEVETVDGKKDFRTGRCYEFEDFGKLETGTTYLLERGKERSDLLKGVVGDRERRLRVEIEPHLHVEAQRAFLKMRKGANLLKHTQRGFPHLRQFQLSSDLRRVVWYSASKPKADTLVKFSSIQEIRVGQATPTFQKYQLPMLCHLSFSLVYVVRGIGSLPTRRTLDLTCKDEFEFDTWLTGFKALVFTAQGKKISKVQLLDHSRRFKLAVERKETSVKLSELPEIATPDMVSLAKCVELPLHSRTEIEKKIAKIDERHFQLREKVRLLIASAAAASAEGSQAATASTAPPPPPPPSGPVQLVMPQTAAAAAAASDAIGEIPKGFLESADASDESMERARASELLETVKELIDSAKTEFAALGPPPAPASGLPTGTLASPSNIPTAATAKSQAAQRADIERQQETEKLKAINQTLWKAEVDLENAEDMCRRLVNPATSQPLSKTISELNASIAEEFQRVGEQITSKLMSWFLPADETETEAT